MTRADSRPSGETQSVPEADFERVMFCMAPPSRRTAPTPTPVATAAARARRRVIPLRTGGTASTTDSGAGALRAMAGYPPRILMPWGKFNPRGVAAASPICEEFVSSTLEHRLRELTPLPGPIGDVRSLVRDGLGPCFAPRVLDPLHHLEPSVRIDRRSALGALGIRVRSRRSRQQLGREGHLPAARAPGFLASVPLAPRGRLA